MGGDKIPGPFDPLVKEFEEWKATLPEVNNLYHLERKWKITRCLSCEEEIKYFPLSMFNGSLKCPHCGVRFKVPSLDKFLGEKNEI